MLTPTAVQQHLAGAANAAVTVAFAEPQINSACSVQRAAVMFTLAPPASAQNLHHPTQKDSPCESADADR